MAAAIGPPKLDEAASLKPTPIDDVGFAADAALQIFELVAQKQTLSLEVTGASRRASWLRNGRLTARASRPERLTALRPVDRHIRTYARAVKPQWASLQPLVLRRGLPQQTQPRWWQGSQAMSPEKLRSRRLLLLWISSAGHRFVSTATCTSCRPCIGEAHSQVSSHELISARRLCGCMVFMLTASIQLISSTSPGLNHPYWRMALRASAGSGE